MQDLAPEVIGNKEFCGYKADTWSFGIVVFELLTGRYPFNQYVSKVLKLTYRNV